MDNAGVARILRETADLLEIKDENPFKIRAYRNAADIAANHPHDLVTLDEAGLREIPGIELALPPGAMYAFFRVHGVRDSLAFCKKLVAEAGLGLAPGIAFGPESEGFVRWCFAASEERIAQGIERLKKVLVHR